MTNQYLEHCMYCGGEVTYSGGETLLKCRMCGRTLVVADFAGEIAKIEAASRESEALKKELEQAKQEKEEADRRLFESLSAIDRLDRSSKASAEILSGLEGTITSLFREQRSLAEKADLLQKQADEANRILGDSFRLQKQEKLQELRQIFRQADNCQRDWEFEKAEEYYRQVLIKGGEDAEIFWRLVQCHYCISYQPDGPDNWVPVILNPDLTDPADLSVRRDMDRAMNDAALTSPEKRGVYLRELERIDEILNRYRLVRRDMDYDVFISVKQNRDGHITTDSDIASELYDKLTEMGLKVFNSRRCRDLFAGKMYEPYIISALMSAKALIVVGTCRENMESQWVKNEWTRFQWLQKKEKAQGRQKERLLLCYLAMGMDPYDLPAGLDPGRQAIKDGINSETELKAALGFLLKGKPGQGRTERGASLSGRSTEDVLRQMQAWLTMGKFDSVQEAYQKLAEDGSTHLGSLPIHLCAICAKNRTTDISDVSRMEADLGQEPAFLLARQFCKDPSDQQKLEEILTQNRRWRAEKKRQSNRKQAPVRILVFAKGDKVREAIEAGADYIGNEETIRKILEEGWIDFDVSIATPDMMGTVGRLARVLAPMGLMPSPAEGTITMDVAGVIREIRSGKKKPRSQRRNEIGDQPFVLAEDWYREGLSRLFAGDSEGAADALEKAASLNLPEAQFCLGVMYFAGEGVRMVNEPQADRWMEKAERRIKELSKGDAGIDPLHALFEKAQGAAADGNLFGQYLTGYMYFYGKGIKKNREEAFHWISLAADAGHAAALDFAGLCCEYGEGISWDPYKAMGWYQKAAASELERGRYHAGMLYVKEKSPYSKNMEIAVRLIRKAAENGYARAQNQMGIFCQTGDGVPKNEKEAFDWYQKAARSGDLLAQNNLGNCYLNGIGVEVNKKEAASSFVMPARKGRPSAQFRLAQLYERGEGISQDLEEAKKLYTLAAEQGHKGAEEALKRLSNE